MKIITRIDRFHWKLVLTLSLALIGLVGAFSNHQAQAQTTEPWSVDSKRLISIFDKGAERTILTQARTVREALTAAHMTVDEGKDVVEPALDSELVAAKYNINIFRARPVVVVDGANRVSVTTAQQTPALIAKAAGVTVHPEDKTEMNAGDNLLVNGATLVMTIHRARVVNMVLYGKPVTVRTFAATIGDMLKERRIALSASDTLSVATGTKIIDGMRVELWRNGKQTVTIDEEVAFKIETVKDANRNAGYKEVKVPGEKGRRTVTYEIEMKNGQELSRREVASVVVKEPKKQVEVVGAKLTNSFTGSFSEALAKLRSCEGSYTSNTGNGYYGAYQFDIRTWGNYGGYTRASDAPPAVQDEKAWLTYRSRGWSPWPACSRRLGLQDIYR